MIKRVNRYFIILLSLILTIVVSGCKLFETKLVTYENELTLQMVEDYKVYFPYTLPIFTLKFDGSLNTTEQRTGPYEVVFTQNDDFFVSDILSKLFAEYEAKNDLLIYNIGTDEEAETWMNTYDEDGNHSKEYIKILDNKIYNEIAYMTLDNGLILSVNYAKIVDWNNNVYYRWQKTESIRMIIHYPLMVTENSNNETMFLLLPLPAGVIKKFDTTTKSLETITTKDKFKNDMSYYTYDYISIWNKETVREYYVNRFNGYEENGVFMIEYFGYNFSVEFNEKNFVIKHLK